MTTSRFALIGPGRLGLRLAARLLDRGWICVGVRGRTRLPDPQRSTLPSGTPCDTWERPTRWAPAQVLFATVPDAEIENVATDLARSFDLTWATVLHTSGLHDANSLEPCRRRGGRVGSWHPLQSFPSLAAGPVRWDGVMCAVEGDIEAVRVGTAIATELGLRPWQIAAEDKVRYHASASVAANLTHILVAEAARIMSSCELPMGDGDHPLWPLVETSLRNALREPGLDLLTGPLARGDSSTVERHLEVLPKSLGKVYEALARLAAERDSG